MELSLSFAGSTSALIESILGGQGIRRKTGVPAAWYDMVGVSCC